MRAIVPGLRPAIIALAVLILGGASYELVAKRLEPLMTKRIDLPVPLASFPHKVGGWLGEDRPLSPEIERAAGNDDYLNRLYVHSLTGEKAGLYIAYSGRPRSMLGHRPQVCYPSQGWVSVHSPEQVQLALSGGEPLPCLIHRFRKSSRAGEVVVLNYYVLNGYPTSEESDFVGVGWRLPNIRGNAAWYVAAVWISSGSEATVRKLAAATADIIRAHLPDAEGKVRVGSNTAIES